MNRLEKVKALAVEFLDEIEYLLVDGVSWKQNELYTLASKTDVVKADTKKLCNHSCVDAALLETLNSDPSMEDEAGATSLVGNVLCYAVLGINRKRDVAIKFKRIIYPVRFCNNGNLIGEKDVSFAAQNRQLLLGIHPLQEKGLIDKDI